MHFHDFRGIWLKLRQLADKRIPLFIGHPWSWGDKPATIPYFVTSEFKYASRMTNSAKNTPDSSEAENHRIDVSIGDARQCVKSGGAVAALARSFGIAQSTVRGRLKGHDGHRGRSKKLGPFEETEIFKRLLADARLQNWKIVIETVRQQSGQSISRRSVFRLLGRWGLVPPTTGPGRTTCVDAIPWEQPQDTLQKGSKALKGTLWQIHSGRGSEGFMLTSGESADELVQVTAAISGGLKGRNRSVPTNHPQLAELLRIALPRWGVRLEK